MRFGFVPAIPTCATRLPPRPIPPRPIPACPSKDYWRGRGTRSQGALSGAGTDSLTPAGGRRVRSSNSTRPRRMPISLTPHRHHGRRISGEKTQGVETVLVVILRRPLLPRRGLWTRRTLCVLAVGCELFGRDWSFSLSVVHVYSPLDGHIPFA